MPKLNLVFLKETKYLKFLILFLLFFWISITILVMFLRLQHPYQLEWMEGGEIEHIQRLLEGKKIYCEPSLDFIPYIYTPFFYYIGVLVSIIWEPNFISIRLVSIISFLLSLFFIYKIIVNYTKDKFWSLLGVGIYALSFSTTGFWFDIARVDTTANLFLIISFYFLVRENQGNVLLSAIFSFLAFYTKQSYLVISVLLTIALFIQARKKAWTFSAVYFTLVILSTVIETIISQGWYFFWNFYFPSTHHWIWSRLITFWTVDVLPFYSISLAIMLSFYLFTLRQNDNSKDLFLLFLFLGSLLTSYSSRLHYGGFLNVLIPFVFSISITFPIALYKLEETLNGKNNSTSWLLLILALFQLTLLFYDPTYIVPSEKDRKDIEQILSYAKSMGGNVYLMGYNFIQKKYGLISYPHYVLLNDLFISKVPEREKILHQFENALKNRKFKAIVLDEDLNLQLLDKYYFKTDIVFYHRVLNSKQSPIRRERVWLPK